MVRLKIGLFAVWGLLGVSVSAQAQSTVVYGLTSAGQTLVIPGSICTLSGQTIRVQPEVVNAWGQRMGFPANRFVWRMTHPNGTYEQWDARYSFGSGPFQLGPETNSVYVTNRSGNGSWGRIDVVSPGYRSVAFYLVDTGGFGENPPQCQWADPAIYVNSTPDPYPSPTPTPPPFAPGPCNNICVEGAKCTDGCPSGASWCNFVTGNVPYWEVVACSRYPNP